MEWLSCMYLRCDAYSRVGGDRLPKSSARLALFHLVSKLPTSLSMPLVLHGKRVFVAASDLVLRTWWRAREGGRLRLAGTAPRVGY
jgi:hypothetical protein